MLDTVELRNCENTDELTFLPPVLPGHGVHLGGRSVAQSPETDDQARQQVLARELSAGDEHRCCAAQGRLLSVRWL